MAEKMLIDATHAEETRVAVVKDNKLIKYESETANRKPLKNNIYLAKVIRVEPSLQAAFVEYGGTRHGFLAFDEIHPDYYQIPAEDKEKFLALQNAENADEENDEQTSQASEEEQAVSETSSDGDKKADKSSDHLPTPNTQDPSLESQDESVSPEQPEQSADTQNESDDQPSIASSSPQKLNNTTHTVSKVANTRRDFRHRYKIQDVIKKRQIVLVQVSKEERGNKGAALTTHLSLAGRYTVLMPNTAKGRGLSRKIQGQKERKKLALISKSLNVPETMGLIIRTAGQSHTKTEIKRDYEYLLRIWNNIRELTLNSIAPQLVYQEGDIIKRTIRDEYDKSITEVLVVGEETYKETRQFMELFMPSCKKNVKKYKDTESIMVKHKVEEQIDAIYSSTVPLESGGYIVIDKTEAVTAVDVNSGGATKERNIESTALNTNIEASKEIARQLRLRDIGGLVVIDFIDMDLHSNNRIVEKNLKQSLALDKARIHVGRISQFGLLEMSRQRLRLDIIEETAVPCPNCKGKGIVNTVTAMAIRLLRAIEAKATKHPNSRLIVLANDEVAYYILNEKRQYISEIEKNTSSEITIKPKNQAIISDFTIHVEKSSRTAANLSDDVTEENTEEDTNTRKPSQSKKTSGRKHKNKDRKNTEKSATKESETKGHSTSENDTIEHTATNNTQESEENSTEKKQAKEPNAPSNSDNRKKTNRRVNTKRHALTPKDLINNRRKRKNSTPKKDGNQTKVAESIEVQPKTPLETETNA